MGQAMPLNSMQQQVPAYHSAALLCYEQHCKDYARSCEGNFLWLTPPHPPSPTRLFRRDGGVAQEDESAGEELFYFAYGANINKQVFSGRRAVTPIESVPAVLHNHRLVFSMPGVPFREPGFASVHSEEEGIHDGGTPPPPCTVAPAAQPRLPAAQPSPPAPARLARPRRRP
jgi:hypothetical protein